MKGKTHPAPTSINRVRAEPTLTLPNASSKSTWSKISTDIESSSSSLPEASRRDMLSTNTIADEDSVIIIDEIDAMVLLFLSNSPSQMTISLGCRLYRGEKFDRKPKGNAPDFNVNRETQALFITLRESIRYIYTFRNFRSYRSILFHVSDPLSHKLRKRVRKSFDSQRVPPGTLRHTSSIINPKFLLGKFFSTSFVSKIVVFQLSSIVVACAFIRPK